MRHLSLEGDWPAMVPLLLAKRESSTHYLDNKPWERKLAQTSMVVGPEGFPKLFHLHIYLGPSPFSLKIIYWALVLISISHSSPHTFNHVPGKKKKKSNLNVKKIFFFFFNVEY